MFYLHIKTTKKYLFNYDNEFRYQHCGELWSVTRFGSWPEVWETLLYINVVRYMSYKIISLKYIYIIYVIVGTSVAPYFSASSSHPFFGSPAPSASRITASHVTTRSRYFLFMLGNDPLWLASAIYHPLCLFLASKHGERLVSPAAGAPRRPSARGGADRKQLRAGNRWAESPGTRLGGMVSLFVSAALCCH